MAGKDKDRDARLAAALRENLRKRKAQARGAEQNVASTQAGASGREGASDEQGASSR